MRQKNAQFANRARAGKNPVKQSRQDKLAKRSPISLWALGIVLFVVVGGGTSAFRFSYDLTHTAGQSSSSCYGSSSYKPTRIRIDEALGSCRQLRVHVGRDSAAKMLKNPQQQLLHQP